ncbi:hypothetical protein [Phaeospirillum tilakii]|uniref:ABC transporter permease n=1 Tax=Phaeospirillum tilakii TaxID=741673 RepID=A0ABW5C901_9PROT
MPATATIIDLDEVRRRRAPAPAATVQTRPVPAWMPVWVMVPVWTIG